MPKETSNARLLLDVLRDGTNAITVRGLCPEQEWLGLPSPRDPIRLYRPHRLANAKTRVDITAQAPPCSEPLLVDHANVRAFLLKAKSPSCGVGDAREYGSVDGGEYTATDGFFTGRLRQQYANAFFASEKSVAVDSVLEEFLQSLV